ncbi:MAG: biosynthetic arginine decarboxylase [Planctomycetota bacterium]|nr:biosynthetic arginine decarboxylase [Planctomycetota bacterium]
MNPALPNLGTSPERPASRQTPAAGTARGAPHAVEWSSAHSAALYNVDGWGLGYFRAAENGQLCVDPDRDGKGEVSLYEVVQGLRERGYAAPVMLRFSDILRNRLADLAGAFQTAITANDYQGRYHAVYPIKVNQQRHLVQEVLAYGEEHGFGLEVGSKPELLAVMSMTAQTAERLIICNGFKDDRYIEAVILSTKIGRNIIPVVESLGELRLIIKYAQKYGVRPQIGARVKLASQGIGRWRDSAGHRAKFGLLVNELIEMVDLLREHDMLDCLKLLHSHVGSQIHEIKAVKNIINELGHLYAEVARMGAGLEYLDIGGGLGVDYDGTQRSTESSMNYTLEEYASDVVFRISNVCRQIGIPHPHIITECGRAMVAYNSVLVFDVLGRTSIESVAREDVRIEDWKGTQKPPIPVMDLYDAYRNLDERNYMERYNDAVQARDEALNLFSLGYLDLQGRALVERMFWSTMVRVRGFMRADQEDYPENLDLEAMLSDTYFCNFSLFQSLPDSWAIDQLFPVMPIHRLDEFPSRKAVLADVTCDSDGKIDKFVSSGAPKGMLEVHDLQEGKEYYLGVFLVGAYQETLGDLHNLFGDTHVAHISVDDEGDWYVEELVPGDTTREVLGYVQYEPEHLAAFLRRDCERAVREKKLTVQESQVLVRFYESGLNGYTYLEREDLRG